MNFDPFNDDFQPRSDPNLDATIKTIIKIGKKQIPGLETTYENYKVSGRINLNHSGVNVGVLNLLCVPEYSLTLCNLLWIFKGNQGLGIGSHFLNLLTEYEVYFVARPIPFEVVTENSLNGQYLSANRWAEWGKEGVRMRKIKDEKSVERLTNFYLKNGFKRCNLSFSEEEFVSNMPNQMNHLTFI